MIKRESVGIITFLQLGRVKAFCELLKFRLSLLVALSSIFGYGLAIQSDFSWQTLFMIFLGGFLLSGSAGTVNQIIERDFDKLMKRTQHRPIPTGRISVEEAILFATLCFACGVIILWHVSNLLTVWLSIFSFLMYCFAYTPLKRVGSVAVFVGAIPGALPPLLGWVAATGHISYEALIIFSIQFIWQFPHFWAIAWVADDDYRKAGFKLLPSGGGRDLNTAVQIMVYTLFLIPLGLLPTKFGIVGIDAAIVTVLVGVAFFAQTLLLMKTGSKKAAFYIMIGSFLYLPLIQFAYILDKSY